MATVESHTQILPNPLCNRPVEEDECDEATDLILRDQNPFAGARVQSTSQAETEQTPCPQHAPSRGKPIKVACGLSALRILVREQPAWVIHHAVDLLGPQADPDGIRLGMVVSALQSTPHLLVAMSSRLAGRGGADLDRVDAVLHEHIAFPSLRAACLVPWLNT